MGQMGSILRRIVSTRGVSTILKPLTRDQVVIFRLHRFSQPHLGIRGHDPEKIREVLQYLWREKYEILPLLDICDRLRGEGPPVRRAVAITIDDGYEDQATIGVPLFAEFDCPVTIFVTTGFLDRKLWLWWDKVGYIFCRADLASIAVSMDGLQAQYGLADDRARVDAVTDFTRRCKLLPHEEIDRALIRLATAAEVDLPETPPPEYSAMTWDQVRACENRGVTFAPHTVTHPILGRASLARSRREILDSWSRVRAEARRPIPVFAYPNGCSGDFGDREIAVLKEAGLRAAVAAIPGYNSATSTQSSPDGQYRLRRFGHAHSLPHVIQYVAGAERLKQLITRPVIRRRH